MREHFDSAVSYVIGVLAIVGSNVLSHANEIMTMGGLIILGLRLYTDGKKAMKTWREDRDSR